METLVKQQATEIERLTSALKAYRGLALEFGMGASYGGPEVHSDAEIVQFLDTLLTQTELFHCVICLKWCHKSVWNEDCGAFGIHRCNACEDLHRRTDDEEVQ